METLPAILAHKYINRQCMFRWKRYPEAVEAYEEAIRLDKKNLSAKRNLESVRKNML